MLNASDADYKNAVAQNLINHSASISDINSTLNDQVQVNGDSGVLETQADHEERITVLEAKGFNPAACTDGTSHWIFVVGSDQACWYRSYAAGIWSAWNGSLGGQFSSGLTAYCYNSGASGAKTSIWVYGQGMSGELWQRIWSGTAWSAAWVDLGGNLD
jgi:hypothetical protein